MGDTLNFFAAAGHSMICAIAFLAFLAFAGFVIYRFFKVKISTIVVISEIVLLGLFLMPAISLCAFGGNLLDEMLSLPFIFTAIGAVTGLIAGLYLWTQYK